MGKGRRNQHAKEGGNLLVPKGIKAEKEQFLFSKGKEHLRHA